MIVTLSASGLPDLAIGDGSNSLCLTGYDLGSPIHRTNAMDAPDTHGTIDMTTLEGGRVLTFGVGCKPYVWADVQAVKAYTRADLRPTITITDDSMPELQATGRVSPFGDQANIGQYVLGEQREFVIQFLGESGVLESAELHQVEVGASGSGALGRAYDLTFDRTYPASSPMGEVEATNLGDRDAYPLIQLHGPWSGVTSAENVTTGKALVFDGENVLAGNYVEIDTRAKTITLNGLSSQSRYHRLDFPDSDWWSLVPGVNVLRFQPTTFSSPARMLVSFRDAYS